MAVAPFPSAVEAAADELSCPFEIVAERTLAEPVEGRTTEADPRPPGLVNLSVFDGPPGEPAELIYDDEVVDSETGTVSWLLQADHPRGYRICCRCANTPVTIAQQPSAGITRCNLGFKKQMSCADGRPVVRSMPCG